MMNNEILVKKTWNEIVLPVFDVGWLLSCKRWRFQDFVTTVQLGLIYLYILMYLTKKKNVTEVNFVSMLTMLALYLS